jgi:hypothetical protein
MAMLFGCEAVLSRVTRGLWLPETREQRTL